MQQLGYINCENGAPDIKIKTLAKQLKTMNAKLNAFFLLLFLFLFRFSFSPSFRFSLFELFATAAEQQQLN